ncbi:hypothetical protein [Pontibacter pamirensis]|uniref:hypothetical protein n=1 Tax=Pontibacter pamirensis TaxID=2562824 RepID=UPI001389ADF0|nr:hypothetical protein [Pontibacter pamirensis]
MNREEAYTILDALAEGCSPFTGELLEDHPILNERKVIRALQLALDALDVKSHGSQQQPASVAASPLEPEMMFNAIEAIKEAGIVPSKSKLTKFLIGSKSFKGSEIITHSLYSALRQQYTYTSLKPLVAKAVQNNKALAAALPGTHTAAAKDKPWDHIDFFEQPTFCTLSHKAIEQLKGKIEAIGIVKQLPILSDYIIQARIIYARAYEPWSETEQEYLAKALHYTNDLKLLTSCFQRGENSIRSVGKKLIFEGKVNSAN